MIYWKIPEEAISQINLENSWINCITLRKSIRINVGTIFIYLPHVSCVVCSSITWILFIPVFIFYTYLYNKQVHYTLRKVWVQTTITSASPVYTTHCSVFRNRLYVILLSRAQKVKLRLPWDSASNSVTFSRTWVWYHDVKTWFQITFLPPTKTSSS